jgi:DNA-binding PadR family transcriptional regulator
MTRTSKNNSRSDPKQVKASILRILSNDPMHWRGVYREIRKIYEKIALETYNSCMKDLLSNKLICKEDVKEKARKFNYSLTTKGNQRMRLLPRIYEAQKIADGLMKRQKGYGKHIFYYSSFARVLNIQLNLKRNLAISYQLKIYR